MLEVNNCCLTEAGPYINIYRTKLEGTTKIKEDPLEQCLKYQQVRQSIGISPVASEMPIQSCSEGPCGITKDI
jgi:hypothetical protein